MSHYKHMTSTWLAEGVWRTSVWNELSYIQSIYRAVVVSLTFCTFGDKRVADEPAYLPRAHSTLTDQLKSLCLFKKFTSFWNGLKEQGKYLSNILDMIGTMMLFVRATRQKLWGSNDPSALVFHASGRMIGKHGISFFLTSAATRQ